MIIKENFSYMKKVILNQTRTLRLSSESTMGRGEDCAAYHIKPKHTTHKVIQITLKLCNQLPLWAKVFTKFRRVRDFDP